MLSEWTACWADCCSNETYVALVLGWFQKEISYYPEGTGGSIDTKLYTIENMLNKQEGYSRRIVQILEAELLRISTSGSDAGARAIRYIPPLI